jgi:hypothetical protein
MMPSILGWMFIKQRSARQVVDSTGKLMESILETKAATLLQFIHGMRGSLHVTFEEGTCAAWLHDLLKPPSPGLDDTKNSLLPPVDGEVFFLTSPFIEHAYSHD